MTDGRAKTPRPKSPVPRRGHAADSAGKAAYAEQLRRLASQVGLQTSYLDTSEQRQETPLATLRAILALWGLPANNPREVTSSLNEHLRRKWRRGLAPVSIAWDGKPFEVEVRLPSKLAEEQMKCLVRLEEGQVRPLTRAPRSSRTLGDALPAGEPFVVKSVRLPGLPWGYHRLQVEVGEQRYSTLIISAPLKSWWPAGRSLDLGLFLPAYSAHSQRSWGAGNLGDLRKLTDWFASVGGNVVSTLPMLGAFLGAPTFDPSPYSPATRLFWNDFYIDVEDVPEFGASPSAQRLYQSKEFQEQLTDFRSASHIDYRAQMAARRSVLEKMARFFFTRESSRRKAFDRFLKAQPAVVDYARFRAACEKTGVAWHNWSERMRSGELRPEDYLREVADYHAYVQWLAHEQMLGFKKECGRRKVRFYLDLPLGVNSDSYDCWREQGAFASGASAGAPPDFFFTKGQDWGFPPLHPERIRLSGYKYMRAFLDFQMRNSDLLRIDHVMGLHRLYWIPRGFPPSQGAYVSYRADELYAILSLESHRHQTGLVGENLGTVPPEVNKAMARHALRQTYVVQYQQRSGPGPALTPPPKQAVASLNTHDMPTFASHWAGLDIEDRVKLGLIRRGQRNQKADERRRLNEALIRFLKRKGLLGKERDGRAVLEACLAWLSGGPAEVVLVNIEDLWQETEPQNVPGTSNERPNWRRKARLTLEQIQESAELRELLARLAEIRVSR